MFPLKRKEGVLCIHSYCWMKDNKTCASRILINFLHSFRFTTTAFIHSSLLLIVFLHYLPVTTSVWCIIHFSKMTFHAWEKSDLLLQKFFKFMKTVPRFAQKLKQTRSTMDQQRTRPALLIPQIIHQIWQDLQWEKRYLTFSIHTYITYREN